MFDRFCDHVIQQVPHVMIHSACSMHRTQPASILSCAAHREYRCFTCLYSHFCAPTAVWPGACGDARLCKVSHTYPRLLRGTSQQRRARPTHVLAFQVALADGTVLHPRRVVCAIGAAGRPRVPPWVPQGYPEVLTDSHRLTPPQPSSTPTAVELRSVACVGSLPA